MTEQMVPVKVGYGEEYPCLYVSQSEPGEVTAGPRAEIPARLFDELNRGLRDATGSRSPDPSLAG